MPKASKKTIIVGKARAPIKVAKKKKEQEMTLLGSALRSLGGIGGGALGGLIGMPAAGTTLGSSLGASLSRWLGSGDYAVQSNSMVTSLKAASSIPMMHKENQSIVVRHREFVGSVTASTNFAVQLSLDLNPGNRVLFPWLAGIAVKFQEYRIRGMVFHYIPTSGASVASTNTALGTVMIQTSYRSADSVPTTKYELLNEYCSNESVPSEAFCHPVECDPKENPFNVQYVRSSAIANSEDKLLYDLGTTNIAVQGCQGTTGNLGDVWVSYEIELRKPIIASNVTTNVTTSTVSCQQPPSMSSGTLFAGTQTKSGSLLCTYAGNTITWPLGASGTFAVTIVLIGTGTGFGPLNMSNSDTLVNMTRAKGPDGNTSLATVLTGAGAVQAPVWIAYVTITDPTKVASYTVPTASALTGTINTSLTTVVPYEYTAP